MEKEKFWWRKEDVYTCAARDMRDLLWKIAQLIGLQNPMGSYDGLPGSQPFLNIFRRPSPSRPHPKQKVFNEDTCEELISRLHQYLQICIHTTAARDRLSQEIDQAFIASGYPMPTHVPHPPMESMTECTKGYRCTTHQFCYKCYGCWLKNTLMDFEGHYTVYKNILIPSYRNEDEVQLVGETYRKIMRFEANFLELKKHGQSFQDAVYALYNDLLPCWSLPLVADEKLAYIKWYAGRFCTWPLMKNSLITCHKYQEENIFNLFNEARCMIKNAASKDEKLIFHVYHDYTQALIACTMENPFFLYQKPTILQDTIKELAAVAERMVDTNLKHSLRQWYKVLAWVSNRQIENDEIPKKQSVTKLTIQDVENIVTRCWVGLISPETASGKMTAYLKNGALRELAKDNYETVEMFMAVYLVILMNTDTENPYDLCKPYLELFPDFSWEIISAPSKYQRIFLDNDPAVHPFGLADYDVKWRRLIIKQESEIKYVEEKRENHDL